MPEHDAIDCADYTATAGGRHQATKLYRVRFQGAGPLAPLGTCDAHDAEIVAGWKEIGCLVEVVESDRQGRLFG